MEAGFSPLSDTLRLLRREAETPNFGNEIVVRNLLSSLFVYFMRDWADAISLMGCLHSQCADLAV
jgi:Cupin